MPLTIPTAVNYPSPLVAVPSLTQDEPMEGRKQVPIEVLWTSMGGTNKTVFINLQNNATLNISQISTLKVDNSQSGADVTFIFPDTSDTIVVPAGTPLVVVPVFSNAQQLYISAPLALAGDVTRVQLLNYQLPPAGIGATTERLSAQSGGAVFGNNNTTIQIVPVGVNGTLQSLQVQFAVSGGVPTVISQSGVQVIDGGGNFLLNSWQYSCGPNSPIIGPSIAFGDLNWRFRNGLQVINLPQTGWTAGGCVANIFAEYVKP